MSMYFIGIDISKYKHDCCIISAADQKVVSKVTIKNNKSGFDELLTIINSLSNPEDIRIGFESTAHYALNLELFLENSLLTFTEVNPVLVCFSFLHPIISTQIIPQLLLSSLLRKGLSTHCYQKDL